MTREAITALFAGFHDAMMRHDAAAIAALYAEDGSLESPWAGTATGPIAIEEVHRAWFTAFPDATLESRELVIDDDRVAWLVQVAGTQTGAFMGFAPTRKPFQFLGVLLFTLGDGRIERDRRIYDFTGLLIQIGLLKAKPV